MAPPSSLSSTTWAWSWIFPIVSWFWITARRSATACPTKSARTQTSFKPISAPATKEEKHGIFPGNPVRRPDDGHAVFVGGAGLRAYLQGLGCVQFCPRRHGAYCGLVDGAVFRMDTSLAGYREPDPGQCAGIRYYGGLHEIGR